MITCGKCQRQNEDHYKFCLGCGTPLAPSEAPAAAPAKEEPALQEAAAASEAVAPAENAPPAAEPAVESGEFITCPSCVARVAVGHRFCRKCGSPIPSNDAPAPVEEAPAAPEAPQPEPEPQAAEAPQADAAPAAAAPAEDVRPQLGQLVMVNPDGTPGDAVPLYEGENILGKESPFPVLQRDEFLSPQHANFIAQSDTIAIQDLDSINGVYYRINEPTAITPGDFVRLGQEVLLFQSTHDFPADDTLEEGQGSSYGTIWGRIARISAPGNQASNAYILWKNEHTIGRERGDFTIPDDGFVSGMHARIFRDGDRVLVEDLQSSNGTYLRIKGSRTVSNNALLLIGKQPFRVKLNAG